MRPRPEDSMRRATAHGDAARTGDPEPAPDPLAFDPLSPIDFAPDPAEPADPFALDPLSPLDNDAG
jgi:hypothetical protein